MADSKGTAGPEAGYVGWTEELETGIDILDDQHRRYIELLNEYIEKANEHTAGSEEEVTHLTESLDFLHQYADEHFSTEDSIMRETEYPEHETHKEEHLHFLKHVGDLCKDMETKGFSHELSREVNYYTIEWFIEHILVSDMKLVEFLKAKNWKMQVD